MHIMIAGLQMIPLLLVTSAVVYLDIDTAVVAVILLGLHRHWPQSDLGTSVIEHKLDTLFERMVGPILLDESYKTIHQASDGDPTPAMFSQKHIDLQRQVESRVMIVRWIQSLGFNTLAIYMIYRIMQTS